MVGWILIERHTLLWSYPTRCEGRRHSGRSVSPICSCPQCRTGDAPQAQRRWHCSIAGRTSGKLACIRPAPQPLRACRRFPSRFPAWASRNAPPSDDIERSGDPGDQEERHDPRFGATRGVASDRSRPGVLLVGGQLDRRPARRDVQRKSRAVHHNPVRGERSPARRLHPGGPGRLPRGRRRPCDQNQSAEHRGSRRCGGAHIGRHYPGDEPRHCHRGRHQGGRTDTVQPGPAISELRPERQRQSARSERHRSVEGGRCPH